MENFTSYNPRPNGNSLLNTCKNNEEFSRNGSQHRANILITTTPKLNSLKKLQRDKHAKSNISRILMSIFLTKYSWAIQFYKTTYKINCD